MIQRDLIHQLEAQYKDLQQTINLLSNGECKITDVKHRSALLGIYREKDDTYMCRVRRNSGRISVKNLHDLADIMEAQQIHHAHFSTRQNIQLHGVPPARVYDTIKACNEAEMLFRGGGGNTFRSIATSPYSGVSPTEAFDTIPHAEAVWEFVRSYERAYGFGRKFKTGFSSEPTDDINAGIQDLGFVAQLRNEQRGFKVYCGGGMGRDPAHGIVLIDFLAEKDVIRVAQAAIDLFFENGNRKIRPKARLRFVLQELGPDAFKQLFFQYLEETTAPDFHPKPIDYTTQVSLLKKGTLSSTDDFEQWVKRSVKNTNHGRSIKSVRLHVRDGNFHAEQFRSLATLLTDCGIVEIRSCNTQDVVIPLIHASKLMELYTGLKRDLSNVINIDGNFMGQVVSCIGATACSIGLLKTETARSSIASALTELMSHYPDIAPLVYESIIHGINISGCASSCGLNQVSAIGFHGHKKRVDGEIVEFYQIHLGGGINEKQHAFGCTDPASLVPASDVTALVITLVQQYLKHVQAHGPQTLREFISSKRTSIEKQSPLSIERIIQLLEE